MQLFLVLLVGLIKNVITAPLTGHVVHEKRDQLPHGWKRYGTVPGPQLLSIRVALRQENLDKAEQFLMDVSHPESKRYGQHWSNKEIAEVFAPSPVSVEAVMEWLHSFGISPKRISKSQSLGWLHFDARVDDTEKLLKTKFYLYKHSTGKHQIACTEYLVPEHISPHIDFITPTVHFDVQISKQASYTEKKPKVDLPTAAVGVPVISDAAMDMGSPDSGSLPKKGTDVDIAEVSDELENCSSYITPNCLRALYRFGLGTSANPQNSLGVVQFSPQVYLQEDLDSFFTKFSVDQVHKTPILNAINGATLESPEKSFAFNGESDIDLEYAMALANPQQVTLYQTGDRLRGASFNDFLDAIDGSYCTFEGGDDPLQDTIYSNTTDGYQGPKFCGAFPATKVISISYAQNEADLTMKYEMRQCMEYLKLGLAGATVLYASGDQGVAGIRNQCIDLNNNRFNNGTAGTFNPQFPASCPFVTSVGATQIRPNATVFDDEMACETHIFSGGGFSNVFAVPEYQTTAVKSWFTNHPPPYGADRFNNSQMTRGIPDISANGANFTVIINGQSILSQGTSLAVPVIASIFTMINEARMNLGKSSIGFVNPVLYAHPDALNDITSGNNPGCGTPGFAAVEGWDPVTGLGTPHFPKLLEIFVALQ